MSEEPEKPARSPVSIVVGIVLAAIGLRYLYLSHERSELERMNNVFAAAAALASAPPVLTRVELPGMSIEAPSGGKLSGDYVNGSLEAKSPIEWAVTWQRGPLPSVAAMKPIVEGMRQTIEARLGSKPRLSAARKRLVGGVPGYEFEITIDLGGAVLTVFGECGGRVVQISSGVSANAKETATRMADTFQCTPDASKDLDRDLVAVDARPGWQRTAATGKAMLVNAREILVRPDVLAGLDEGPLEDIVPTALRAGGFMVDASKPEERAGRKVWRASMTLDGRAREAAIVVWWCPEQKRTAAIYVVSMGGAPIADGVDLALTGRCLGPDDKAPSYPLKRAGAR